MNKWEVDEHEQWSEKVRSQCFCPLLIDKNGNYKGIRSNKRKSFAKQVGMNDSNFFKYGVLRTRKLVHWRVLSIRTCSILELNSVNQVNFIIYVVIFIPVL